MCVIKSNKHIEVQLIDDEQGKTLIGLSTRGASNEMPGRTKEAARQLGTKLAEGALAKGVSTVSFDRGWHKYHGVLQELADAARAAGLQF
jgi:large subunit ribosomal protein L18